MCSAPGPHFSEQDATELYSEGFRGRNSVGSPGKGHGLAFIRHVIELHGGKVGYEPTTQGNNFYFVLPMLSVQPPEDFETYHRFELSEEGSTTKLSGAERRSSIKNRRFREDRRNSSDERREGTKKD